MVFFGPILTSTASCKAAHHMHVWCAKTAPAAHQILASIVGFVKALGTVLRHRQRGWKLQQLALSNKFVVVNALVMDQK